MKEVTVRSVLYKNQQWLNSSDLILWLIASADQDTWGGGGRDFVSNCVRVLAEMREEALSSGKAEPCVT